MVEDGHREPIPDWVAYLVAADEMNVSPQSLQRYDLPDGRWWMHKALIFREAKAINAERDREAQEAKARRQQQQQATRRR